MSKSQPLLNDLLTLGGSLFANLADQRHEFKTQAKNRVDRIAQKLDLVTRDEFDAAFAMLAKARDIQEDIQERLTRVEASLNLSSTEKKNKKSKQNLPSVKQGKKRATRK